MISMPKFIALIPKVDKPQSYDDYHPISLCNCIYQIIEKIIENRLNLILSKHISKEQFAFFDECQIHEAIGIAQEAWHNLKTRKLKGMI